MASLRQETRNRLPAVSSHSKLGQFLLVKFPMVVVTYFAMLTMLCLLMALFLFLMHFFTMGELCMSHRHCQSGCAQKCEDGNQFFHLKTPMHGWIDYV
jgi:hypothetical protein